MEHFCQNIQGWFSFAGIYQDQVKLAQDGAHFVEVGAWLGKSTAFMGVEIINSNKKIKFDVVDIWDDFAHTTCFQGVKGLYEKYLENIKPVEHCITSLKMKSVDAAALYKDESLDFVFIDASHEELDVLDDFAAWYPKVKKGGFIGGHDYHPTWSGVMRAVDKSLEGKVFEKKQDSWLYQKV